MICLNQNEQNQRTEEIDHNLVKYDPNKQLLSLGDQGNFGRVSVVNAQQMVSFKKQNYTKIFLSSCLKSGSGFFRTLKPVKFIGTGTYDIFEILGHKINFPSTVGYFFRSIAKVQDFFSEMD
jgi:hypothetical protein